MATSEQHAVPAGDPGPTVFVLFGATGDLAKRLVLPAFYRLETEGLLPKQWRLVGNGRGDVAHEDFRAHFHDSLVEFDTAPDPKQWDAFSQNLFFAGGGFTADRPRQPARRDRQGPHRARRRPAAGPLPGRPARRLRRADEGAGPARAGQGLPRGLREAVRHLAGELPRARRGRPLGPRRAAGVQDRPLPRQGSDPGPAHAAVRERTVRLVLGPRVHRVGPDRRARDARHQRPGACSTTPPARCST